MSDLPSHLYVRAGLASGHDAGVLARAAHTRAVITGNGGVPVLTLSDLAKQTEVAYGYVRRVIDRSIDEYDSILRMKSDGTTRTISSPRPELLHVQRWLLHNCLSQVPQHDSSFAYRKNRSIVGCAQRHVGANWLVKLDLHNFFGQIPEQRVYRVFRNLGYPALLSFEMARLCTRVLPGSDRVWTLDRGVEDYDLATPGVLPQGAATSGALANAISMDLDLSLSNIADSLGFVYTRYSDDMTFSSAQTFSRRAAMKLVKQVNGAIFGLGFETHTKKTRIVPPGARKIVLGLLVDDRGVRLMPEFRRQVSNHVRGVEGWGLVPHSNHRGFDSTLSFVNYVEGCLAFAKGVDQVWASDMSDRWVAALAGRGFPIAQ